MSRKNLPWIITAVSVITLGGILLGQRMGRTAHHSDPRPGITGARVLPASRFASSGQAVRAYTAAARNAEVLDGIYCYCRCKENLGHRSLLECFESDHGWQCDICMGEAMMAAQLKQEGRTLDAIRRAIDRQYQS